MRQTCPLPDTHPELTVIDWDGFREYRVANWRLARDGSGRIVRGTKVCNWADAGMLALVIAYFIGGYDSAVLSRRVLVCVGAAVTRLLWIRFTQTLHESILVFPTLGIQLETHRGHPLFRFPSFATRHFIPLSALEDVVIHEGLRRWNVRFYLALIQRRRAPTLTSHASDVLTGASGTGRIEIRVAFENILPYFPVLKQVYLGVHETMFPPPTRVIDDQVGQVVMESRTSVLDRQTENGSRATDDLSYHKVTFR